MLDMSARSFVPKENVDGRQVHGGKPRSYSEEATHSFGTHDEGMKKYIAKLKQELSEQRLKVRRVHQEKADEIKRLHDSFDQDKLKAIASMSKKMEQDKAYELKKLRDTVNRQKESELRAIVRAKDEELRALRNELQETKTNNKIVEFENKRLLGDRLKGEATDHNQRLKAEISALKQDKKNLEDSLRIKTESDFAKAEEIRKIRHEYDLEIQRLTREAKRESFKEFQHLKSASKQIEVKNHELATKEAELHRLEEQRHTLDNSLISQRKRRAEIELSSPHKKKSDSDFDKLADEKIKKLKMRNSELVNIARKLEEKAKRLQEERDILEKSTGSSSEVGQLKKAFTRQRAKDLAEHAKVLMKKDCEIDKLKNGVQQGNKDALNKVEDVAELRNILEKNSKERLLLEKQLAKTKQRLSEEIHDLREQNARMSRNNEMLKEELAKLQDIEAKHYETVFEMDELRNERKQLEARGLEKDQKIATLETQNQQYMEKNRLLQQESEELSRKIKGLEELREECGMLKDNIQYLKNDNELLSSENEKLRSQIANFTELENKMAKLQQDNTSLLRENQDCVLKLKQRDSDVASLHTIQRETQEKHEERVSGLEEAIERLKSQQVSTTPLKENSTSHYVLNSTPKDTKFTQTSRSSSPALSPIRDECLQNTTEGIEVDGVSEDENHDTLCVPADGDDDNTTSSASFDLEKAGNRIGQLAASDSDADGAQAKRSGTESLYSSDLSSSDHGCEEDDERSIDSGSDTSYSADISQATDHDDDIVAEPHDIDAGVFIGSPPSDMLDISEKLAIFIAKYSYDPMLYSPNENPEVELAFQAGDYLYVYGDVDEDGFFVGELMNGERGLVPSNFIERIADDEAILKEDGDNVDNHEDDDDDDDEYSEDGSSEDELPMLRDEDGIRKVIRPKAFSERRHEMFRTSLDHVLTDQLADIRESDEEELSSAASDDWTNKQRRNDRTEADQNISEGLVSTESEDLPQRVYSPTKLSLDRQFTSSALVSWEAASQLSSEQIQGYNVYVNGKFKTQVRGNNKTNVLVEDVYPNETYRVSVRTKTVNGKESSDKESTIVFGPDAKLSVYDLTVTNVTETSAMITWTPANSCYAHAIHLGESLIANLKPSISSYTLSELTPSTHYHVLVKTQIPNGIQLPLHGETSHVIDHASEIEFTTLCGGLPDPPLDLSLDKQTPECLSFTWLPVTISQAGYSNGFTVTNYKIYVNGVYCAETDSADIDSVSVSKERLTELGKRHDLTRMRFVARTQSVLGESVDSNVVELLNTEENASCLVLQETAVQSSTMPAVSSSPEDAKNGLMSSEIGTMFSKNAIDDSATSLVLQPDVHEETRQKETPENSLIISDGVKAISEEVTADSEIEPTVNSEIEPTVNYEVKPTVDSEVERTVDSEVEPTIDSEGKPTFYSNAEHGNEDVLEGYTTYHEDVTVISEEVPTYFSTDLPNAGSQADSCLRSEATVGDSDANISEESRVESSDDNRTVRAEHKLDEAVCELSDVVRYDVENEPSESGSCTAESITGTEDEVVEMFARPEEPVQDYMPQSNSISKEKPLAKTSEGLKIDEEDLNTQGEVVQLDKVSTDSDTETDFSEVLSVIQEVDEDNLTVSESATAAESRDEKGGSTSREDRTNTDTLRSTILSDSGTKAVSSDDDGFRTEDDVLDLLDDDEVTRVISMATDIVNENSASTPRDEHVVTPPGGKVLSTNSSDNLSESSLPTRNSITSESLSSTSEAPPPPDEAEDAILYMLSLPDGRVSADVNKVVSNENLPPLSQSEVVSEDNDVVSQGADVISEDAGAMSEDAEVISEDAGVISEDAEVVSENGDVTSVPVRYFIALYEYDPIKMSPNDDGADEELAFREGDLIKIFGEKDGDGFFWGECKNKQGFVPSNMVSEITLEEAEDLYNEPMFDSLSFDQIPTSNGHLEIDVDDLIRDDVTPAPVSPVNERARNRLSFWDRADSAEFEARKMRAKFDYDPVKDSPNVDQEIELMFKTGDIIYVFGDMDDDGFFQGELDGMRGLVPSNFLEHVQPSSDSSTSHLSSLPPSTSSSTEHLQDIHESSVLPNGTQKGGHTKKKKGLFSKGKKIFKKAFR